MKTDWRKPLNFLLALTLCLGLAVPAFAAATPAKSGNVNGQDYIHSNWTVGRESYLFENSSGGLTRVEKLGYLDGDQIVVEDYDSQFRCVASRTIPRELATWGGFAGFFAGEDYNFFFFTQTNPEESKDKEVLRVVKYSKDWQRLGSASLYGANTRSPGYALRCAEYGGYLYVHTSHTMFKTADGLNHQTNMSFAVRESDMTITDGFYRPISMSQGYASHSFNQFILVDHEQNIVTLDQGDGYPRAVTLFRYNTKAGQETFISGGGSRKNLVTYPGKIGQNYTGVELGGFAETANGYVAAYNRDGDTTDPYLGLKDRYVHLAFADKDLSEVRDVQITTGYDTTTPQLAPTGLDGGYILWNRWTPESVWGELYYARYDADGNVGPVQRFDSQACLSDCAPICWNGQVVWYTTYDTIPTFYTLDSSGLKAHTIGVGAPQSPEYTAYANSQTILVDDELLDFQTYALKDSSGGLTNYVRLRDLAYHLSVTNAKFSVDWSAAQGITMVTGRPYTANGSELSTPFFGDRAFRWGTEKTTINSKSVDLSSIVLTAEDGGDFTYYKLRDLGRALGFNVSYIDGQVVINTNEPYSDEQ